MAHMSTYLSVDQTSQPVVASTNPTMDRKSKPARPRTPWVDGYVKEEIDPDHNDFKWIKSKVGKTTGAMVINIQKVYRIKNSIVWNAYKEKRSQIFEETGGKEKVLEKRLFHGSPWSMNIAQEGFSLQLAKETGVFGKGVYFSELASESCAYSQKNGVQEAYYMLVCRVALGTAASSNPLPNGCHSVHCGSKHVIYDQKQAYPSYLIEFTS